MRVAESVDYAPLEPAAMSAAVDSALLAAAALIDAAVADADAGFEGLFGRLDEAMREIARARGRTAFASFVDPDEERRTAAEAAAVGLERGRQELVGREDVAAVVGRADWDHHPLDPEQRAVLARWRADVSAAGMSLPAKERDEVRTLADRLVQASSTFLATLNHPPHVELAASELAGVPADVLASLAQGAAAGTLDVPLSDPMCYTIAERAHSRDVRQRVTGLFMDRGGDGNREILADVSGIRREIATRLGHPSWAAMRLGQLAAHDVSTVETFLADLAGRASPIARDEVAAMREDLGASIGCEPDDVVVEEWDWRYFDTRQHEAMGADPDVLRDYLAFEDVLLGMADVVAEVFGVRLEPRADRPAWHPHVRAFDLVDAESGDVLAAVFVDPYARDGKTPGAFAEALDPGSRSPDRESLPVLALVTNATPPSEGEALLVPSDVATMFHEFGHVVHMALALRRGRYWLANDQWAPMDWIEAPSQFLGRWGTQPAVLARFARHRDTGAPIPPEVLASLQRSEHLNAGLRTLRMVYMSLFDQAMHGADPVDLEQANRTAWSVKPVPFAEGTFQPASIAHLVGGYDAAFYGYLWSEVYSDDLMTPFQAEGMLSPSVGARYRKQVLECPILVAPMEGVRTFLGREPSSDAFFARISGNHDPAG